MCIVSVRRSCTINPPCHFPFSGPHAAATLTAPRRAPPTAPPASDRSAGVRESVPRLMPPPAARAALQCTAVDRSAEGLLRGTSSQRGILSLVTGARVGHAPAVDITADSVRVRVLRQGPAIMARLFQDVSAELANQFPGDPTLAPFANDVYALVESTLEGGARSRPWLRPPPAGDARLLPGSCPAS